MNPSSQVGACFVFILSMSPYVLNGCGLTSLWCAVSLMVGSVSRVSVLCGIRVSVMFVCGVPFLHR